MSACRGEADVMCYFFLLSGLPRNSSCMTNRLNTGDDSSSRECYLKEKICITCPRETQERKRDYGNGGELSYLWIHIPASARANAPISLYLLLDPAQLFAAVAVALGLRITPAERLAVAHAH
jgi:hypothetical protein